MRANGGGGGGGLGIHNFATPMTAKGEGTMNMGQTKMGGGSTIQTIGTLNSMNLDNILKKNEQRLASYDTGYKVSAPGDELTKLDDILEDFGSGMDDTYKKKAPVYL